MAAEKNDLSSDGATCIASDGPSHFFWHKHFKRIFVISSENFSFENFKLFSIDVVLMFSPRWSSFFVLQTPVNREQGRQDLKLIASHKHLVNLRVSRVTVADESLVMLWVVIRRDEKWYIQELWKKKDEKKLLQQKF